MPLTLGEKLRQAREERGISISEIAEQTRISPHYLECIENNDFKTLPGGIFNKGFVKSFARYVGVNEAEAVQDYIMALGETEAGDADIPKAYHPEVLTDDRSISSMVPTILFAVIILALMTGGILFIVRYLQNPSPSTNQAAASTPASGNESVNSNSVNANIAAPPASSDKIRVELKAVSESVWISYSVDGASKIQTLAPDESLKVDAANSFKISYSKAKLPNLQVSVNGRQITVPSPSSKGKIEFEINKENINQFTESGQAPSSAETTTSEETSKPSPSREPKRTPQPETLTTPKPSPGASTTPKPNPTVMIVGNQKPKAAPTNRPN